MAVVASALLASLLFLLFLAYHLRRLLRFRRWDHFPGPKAITRCEGELKIKSFPHADLI